MFNESQLDALKELCNIGSGSAATVLSAFLCADIRIEVPRILNAPEAERLFGGGGEWVMVGHAIGGPLGGRLVVTAREKDVRKILRALLGGVPPGWRENDMAASAIREVSNILTSYFLAVLGRFFDQVLVPGVPDLEVGSPATLMENLAAREGMLVETSFREKGGSSLWYLFVLPDPPAMELALNRLLEKGS